MKGGQEISQQRNTCLNGKERTRRNRNNTHKHSQLHFSARLGFVCVFLPFFSTRSHDHTHSQTHTRTHSHTRTDAHTHSHTLTLTHTHAHSRTRTLTQTHTHTHTLAHSRTRTHTLTHTHFHTRLVLGDDAEPRRKTERERTVDPEWRRGKSGGRLWKWKQIGRRHGCKRQCRCGRPH